MSHWPQYGGRFGGLNRRLEKIYFISNDYACNLRTQFLLNALDGNFDPVGGKVFEVLSEVDGATAS